MKIDNVLPKLYKDIDKKGYTNYNNFKSFDNINQNYLWFNNLLWLTYDEIILENLGEFHNIKLIPFANTVGGDYWCLDLNHKDYVPIVCCYHDDGQAKYYAKTLEAALFRQILDFACTEFTISGIKNEYSVETGEQVILNWINKLKNYFPNEWIYELNNIISGKYYTSSAGYVEMISGSKYQELIQKFIDFDLLDKEFFWATGGVTKFYK